MSRRRWLVSRVVAVSTGCVSAMRPSRALVARLQLHTLPRESAVTSCRSAAWCGQHKRVMRSRWWPTRRSISWSTEPVNRPVNAHQVKAVVVHY